MNSISDNPTKIKVSFDLPGLLRPTPEIEGALAHIYISEQKFRCLIG